MTKQKKAKTHYYHGKFTSRLVWMVFIVMLLTILCIVAIWGSSVAVNGTYDVFGFLDPYFTLISLFVCALFLGTVIAFISSGFFLRPVRSLEDAMEKVAKGNFDVRLQGDKVTQIGKLMNNFNKMASDLSKIETFKSDFITNVSHEFKTPLSNIQGYATLLQNSELTEDERNTYLSYLVDATQKLSSLTTNILKLSKLENTSITEKTEKIDLAEEIRQSILLLEPCWTDKNIDVDIDLSEKIYIWGNDELLRQIWSNLLSNAIKFTPEGGKIWIKLRIAGKNARVTVTDNGIGMSEETQSQIFEKFYQADNSHSNEGNGLGLSLTKRIVDASGGKIEVKSELNNGSEFIVLLPAKSKS